MGKTKTSGRRNAFGPSKGHPSHLKGREIGLYYAERSRARTEEIRKKPIGSIKLSSAKREQIQAMLKSNINENLMVVDDDDYHHVQDSVFKQDFLRVINEKLEDKLENCSITVSEDVVFNNICYEEYLEQLRNSKYIQMLKKRKKLPSFDKENEILQAIDENQVVVISGETGCGKTTQVPQFILDSFIQRKKGSLCKVLCTQPRRISAIAVATRVADERAEQLGRSVGYQIRMERKLPRQQASICFCTTGVVLRLMETDPSLSSVSHLILDEIHERDVMSDFILALIKKVMKKRLDLKVILMSATLNADKFSNYFNNAPHIHIPGFTYPVQEFYLEDVIFKTGFVFENKRLSNQKIKEHSKFIEPYVRDLERKKLYNRNVCIQLRNPLCEEINLDLIFRLLIHICQHEDDDGAILIFLTGFADISALTKMITESKDFPPGKYLTFPLHSLMPTIEQKQIFEVPPSGMRKIIIATNIAETSITIEDVVYVIDCGKIKVSGFNVKTNTDVLAPEWVSLANANQRRGRAGRVKSGMCFHLFTKARSMVLDKYQIPEILRCRLEGVILTAKVLQLGDTLSFFKELIESPDLESINTALDLLKKLHALTTEEKLTPLGYHLAKLPIAPQLGKMILFGAIFSCLNPILSVAVTLDYKDPFVLPLGKENEANRKKMRLANNCKSDHLLFHTVLTEFESARHSVKNFCWEYFLSYSTLKQLHEMKKQFMDFLHEMNFVSNSNPNSPECNKNSDNLCLIKAVICAGLFPNIAISKAMGGKPLYTPEMRRMCFHPKSVLADLRYFDSNILVYYRKVHSNSDYIYDGSLIHPLPVVFFGDKFFRTYDNGRNVISINDNLKFFCNEESAAIILDLRKKFNAFLEYKIAHPGPVIWGKDKETKVLEIIAELITAEDLDIDDDFSSDEA